MSWHSNHHFHPWVSNKNKKRTKYNLNKERVAKGLIRDTWLSPKWHLTFTERRASLVNLWTYLRRDLPHKIYVTRETLKISLKSYAQEKIFKVFLLNTWCRNILRIRAWKEIRPPSPFLCYLPKSCARKINDREPFITFLSPKYPKVKRRANNR